MKKFVVLLLILGMASLASAWTMKISVDGCVDPEDTTITLAPSDTALIDIHVCDNENWPSGGKAAHLALSGTAGITWDIESEDYYAWEQTTVSDSTETYAAPIAEYLGVPISQTLLITVVDSSDPFTDPLGKVLDGLIFHCDGEGDVTLILLDFDTAATLDTQVIHQVIPEPMTVLLLGLGGLLLRRRR
jgi:hypothetical protein